MLGCRVVKGKNLFDISRVKTAALFVNNGDGTLTVGARAVSGGTPNTLGDYCPLLQPNDIITLSATTTSTNKFLYLYGSNRALTFGSSYTITQSDLNSRVAWYNDSDSGLAATISNIQIEYGTTATTYEPYYGYKLIPANSCRIISSDNIVEAYKQYRVDGYYLNQSGQLVANANYCYFDCYIDIGTDAQVIMRGVPSSFTAMLIEYGADKTVKDYWGVANRSVSFGSTTRYIRLSMAISDLTTATVKWGSNRVNRVMSVLNPCRIVEGLGVTPNYERASYKNDVTDTRMFYMVWRLSTSPYTALISDIIRTGEYANIVTASFTGTTSVLHSGNQTNINIANNVVSVISGHKYYFTLYANSVDLSTVNGLDLSNIQIFDLTATYGAGNEPSTITEAKLRLFHKYE